MLHDVGYDPMGEFVLRERVSVLASRDRIARFVAVGTVGASVDMLLLVFFHGILGIPLAPGKLLSAELSFLFMFVINEHWTFADYGTPTVRERFRRLLRSNAVRLAGLLTATAVLLTLTTTMDTWYPVANGVGMAVGFVVNYSFESLFTWQVHEG